MTGEHDSVWAACKKPALAGPSWSWIAKCVEEQRQEQTEADASKPVEQVQAESDELVGLAKTHFDELKRNVDDVVSGMAISRLIQLVSVNSAWVVRVAI